MNELIDDSPRKRRILGVDVDPTISLGQLGYIVVTGITFMWLTFGYVVRIDANQTEMTKFKVEVSDRITNLRSEVLDKISNQQSVTSGQYRDIQNAIANLPDVRATITSLEKRMDQADNRAAAQSNRLDTVQAVGVQNSSDIVGLLRGLAGAPRPSGVR